MRVKSTRVVKLAELETNKFVRKELDQDHIMYLAELVANGVEMKDPIEVTPTPEGKLEIVDGRHRKEAYELNDRTEGKVRVIEFDSVSEMIAYAYRANTGGSKPPTPADTEHTITQLIEQGETHKYVSELLGLPTGMVRRYVKDIQSKLNRTKLARAAESVTEGGLTMAKAAEQHDVPPDKLKEVLSGHRRKNNRLGIADVHRGLTSQYKSHSQKQAAALKKLLEKFEDGDVSKKQLEEIFAHIEKLQKAATRSVSDWKQRFVALNGHGK
jgi:ParB-like chromosome segregation protein Spo0J